jgi:glycosyltransferase involved in cell wall biosynthesis
VVLLHRRGRPRPPFADFLARQGVDHVVLDERGPADLALLGAVRRQAEGFGADVVQTHGYKPTVLAYLLRRGGARWPWVAFFHGSTTEDWKVRVYHWLDARLMPAADRVLVMSRAHADAFSQLGRRVQVLYNAAVPLSAEGSAPDLAAVRAGRDGVPRPLIGVVGRLSSEKGVDVFLRACAELAARGTAFAAAVVGDGPDRAELESLRDEVGLAGHVQFVGAVRGVHAVYPQLDLVVLPSRSEGLPNVLLEALQHDVPVVATRVGAVPEVLDDPAAGRVVPPADASALARAIGAALAEGRTPANTAARAAAAARFSLDARAQAHVALYDSVLAAGRAAL